MLLAMALLVIGEATDGAAPLIDRIRALTAPRAGCADRPQPGEVVVCARRRADRYRLPLVAGQAGTRADPTPAQRLAAIRPESNCETMSVFLVGCGSVGAGIGIDGDGKRRVLSARERTADIVP